MFDPRRPSLRHKIDRGLALGVHWVALGSPALVEIVARTRPDAIVLDTQHGLFDRAELEWAIGLVPPDVPVIVRIAENTPMAIGQALDAGAEGVMVPLVESAKEARKAVKAARYPPHGARSGGASRPLSQFVDYVEAMEQAAVVIVMIETAKGVKNAEAIAAVDGLDMVFIGTGDLALSLGPFPHFNAEHEAACETIRLACRKHWTPCGTFTGTVEAAQRRKGQGYRMVVLANDIEAIAKTFGAAVQSWRAPPVAAKPVSVADPTPQITVRPRP
jgi:2-keto-3-deoxy-L-rhamnonate aldolase RhmA